MDEYSLIFERRFVRFKKVKVCGSEQAHGEIIKRALSTLSM
jgi:hypothetical protein